MRKPVQKDLGVFDFKDEDKVELISKELVGRFCRSRKKNREEFRTPQAGTSPLTKYSFLKTFSAGIRSESKTMSGISCIDIDMSDCNPGSNDNDARAIGTFNVEECVIKGASGCDEIPLSNSTSHTEDAHPNPHPVDCAHLFSPSNSSFGTSSKSENPLATGASRLEVPSSENGQIHCDLLDQPSSKNPVDVMSEDGGSMACSSDMREHQEDSVADDNSNGGEMESINSGVTVSPDYLYYKDLYSTESSLRFSCSCIKLEGLSPYGRKGAFSFEWEISDVIGIESEWWARVETAQIKLYIKSAVDLETDIQAGTSGTLELKFAVYDPRWFDIQEQIMSLDSRYKTIWRDLPDIDSNEDAFARRDQIVSSKCYFPSFDEPFEDVIYPKGDPDAVSISKRDVELLKPETFINDTIIDFYIKYLKNKIKPEDRNKFHFFNSFFFRKLADLDKNPSSASEGRPAFLRVRKWTRKVNLFDKDYVFIPVNFSLHWSLLVICHPGEVATFRGEEIDMSTKVPCILHMDSIKGSHKNLKNLIQSYLWEEWKERNPEASEDASSNFSNLRFVPLELPQQENSFDCGLFLLHYAEKFIEEAPLAFNPFKLKKADNFLNSDWFAPVEASLKRAKIQSLIFNLLKEYSPDHSDAQDQSIEIKLLRTPGVSSTAQFLGESGLVFNEFLPNGEFQNFEKDEETGEEFVYSPSRGGGGFALENFGICEEEDDQDDGYISGSESSSSDLLEIYENQQEIDNSLENHSLYSPQSPGSMMEMDTRVVEDSQEIDDQEEENQVNM